MNIHEVMLRGGPVMWPLLACSVAVVTIITERFIFWAQLRMRCDRAMRTEVLRTAGCGDWHRAEEMSNRSNDYVVRVLGAGIRNRHIGVDTAMEAEGRRVLKEMSRFMAILDTMITAAPLLGIFGTVLGIISSFRALGPGGVADPGLVSGGIAQALLTTAAGLAVSIITVFPYNYLRSRIEDAADEMEGAAAALEALSRKEVSGGKIPSNRAVRQPYKGAVYEDPA